MTLNPVVYIDPAMSVISLIVMMVFLSTNRNLKKSRRAEDVMFKYLVISVMVFDVLSLLRYVAILKTEYIFHAGLFYFLMYLEDPAWLFYTYMWVLFVDTALNHSVDTVKRKFRTGLIPIIFMLVLFLVNACVDYNIDTSGEIPSRETLKMMGTMASIYYFMAIVISMLYMLYAFRLVSVYNKEIKQPLFLRLDIFIIPWAIAFLAEILRNILPHVARGVFTVPDVNALCAAVSVLLTYLSMSRRYKYMDLETGFYREDFLSVFRKYVADNKLEYCSVVAIKAGEEPKRMAEELKELQPEKSTVIALNNGDHLLFSNVGNESALKLFEKVLRQSVGKPELEVRHSFREKDEPVEDFIRRISKKNGG